MDHPYIIVVGYGKYIRVNGKVQLVPPPVPLSTLVKRIPQHPYVSTLMDRYESIEELARQFREMLLEEDEEPVLCEPCLATLNELPNDLDAYFLTHLIT